MGEGSALSRAYALERTQVVQVPLEDAFAFFADARNLEQITPPWLRFRIVEAPGELRVGARLRYRLSLFGIPIRWRTEIVAWTPPRGFVDVQRRGPFRLWEHTHRLTPVEDGTEIYDHVRYRLFLGPVGALVRLLLVRRWVEGIFDYRAERVPGLLTGAPAARPRRTA
ncbi:MAG TPA: SRPBCC family protein [Gaiellaceae bacterium]|nr:SRPBCC family protein [Gaiellaceae bacterium]